MIVIDVRARSGSFHACSGVHARARTSRLPSTLRLPHLDKTLSNHTVLPSGLSLCGVTVEKEPLCFRGQTNSCRTSANNAGGEEIEAVTMYNGGRDADEAAAAEMEAQGNERSWDAEEARAAVRESLSSPSREDAGFTGLSAADDLAYTTASLEAILAAREADKVALHADAFVLPSC